jgi:RNA polymerase sigma-70 factor (ECF subfamily)
MREENLNMSDDELVEQCLEKDVKAQKLLFQRFAPKMMGVCLRYASSSIEAEDMLQEGLIKVYEKLKMYSGKGSLEGWIRRIVVNTALDIIRKNKKMKFNTSIDDVEYSLKKEQYIIENLTVNDLMKILQTIPVGYRTVFNMYAIEGFSHKEIAEELGISVSTSKSQLSRARTVLKRIIEDNDLL